MRLCRYDVKATRVCAELPYSASSLARLVIGGRFDATWIDPSSPTASPLKVWHWPAMSIPLILRTLPGVTTADPLIGLMFERANRINAARADTVDRARRLAAIFSDAMLPRSGEKRLRGHQRNAVRASLSAGGTRGIFHQTGTGKTITAATLLDLLVQPIDGMRVGVVVCPVTLIESAWAKDLSEWCPSLPYVNLRRAKKGVAREMLTQEALQRHGRVVALVNYEAFRTDPSVRKIASGAYVVFDECSKMKARDSGIAEVARISASTFRGCLLLSGTPAPNDRKEYWPLAKVLAAPAGYDPFPGSASAFDREFCEVEKFDRANDNCRSCGRPKWQHRGGQGCGKFVGAGHFAGHRFKAEKIALLHERLAPICEWVKKEECLDLPPKAYVDVPLELAPATADAYRQMRDMMKVAIRRKYATADELEVHAQNALVQLLRLRQITAGFVPAQPESWVAGSDEPMVMLPIGAEKIDWLLERCEVDAERIVLWTQFQFEVDRYTSALAKAKIKAAAITGRTPESERAGVFARFVAGDFQVLVAHPGVAQWGVSFPGVTQACYGSLSYSLQEFAQSQDRIHGIGRGDATKRSTFYRLAARVDGAPTIDQDLIDVLDGKRKALDLVFDLDRSRRESGFVPANVGAVLDT